mgnify:CR=1 FL=1
MNSELILQGEVQAFLTREAELLDERRFEEWLELFDDEGVYWVPSSPTQEDMHGQVSIILEDRDLLNLRINRLRHPNVHAFNPPPSSIHLIGNVSATIDGEFVIAKSKLIVTEFRNDNDTNLSGTTTHTLKRTTAGFKIKLKRVDLIQAGGTFSAITIPL